MWRNYDVKIFCIEYKIQKSKNNCFPLPFYLLKIKDGERERGESECQERGCQWFFFLFTPSFLLILAYFKHHGTSHIHNSVITIYFNGRTTEVVIHRTTGDFKI